MNLKMKYRPDIDGLRAIAVLAVLFYHARLKGFSGGYIGVDIFFVISGFLITSKIVKGIQANSFSLLTFYEQRIRRIFPALLVTIIATLFIGSWLFDAESYAALGESSVATTLSLANILFWSQAGYFDAPSTLKPLLHTWSLSIEEQFYLILPLLLVLLFRYLKPRVLLALSLIFAVSLALSVYIVPRDASAAFYFLQYRAWELLLGSFLALKTFNLKKIHKNALSIAGLLMILAPIAIYSDSTPFPGASAILPVFGTAFIILAGIENKSTVGKMLGTRPFVFIGKISYSLYLWHWPLLVFFKYYLIREITIIEIILWLLFTFAFSTASWKFIETPFRSRAFLPRPKIFSFAGIVAAFAILFGFSVYKMQGFPSRPNHQISAEQIAKANTEKGVWDECLSWGEQDYDFSQIAEKCTLGVVNEPPSFILWGDSHAEALAPAINASALESGATGYIISGSGCPPLLDLNFSVLPYCYEHNNDVLAYIEAHPEIEKIILVGRWALYTELSRYKSEEGSSSTLIDMSADGIVRTNTELFKMGLEKTISALSDLDRDVILVAPVPEVGYMVPTAYSIASRTGRDVNEIIAPSREEYFTRNATTFSVFEQLETEMGNFQILDPSVILCDQKECKVTAENVPLYRDDDHLSTFGAYSISSIFDPVFKK